MSKMKKSECRSRSCGKNSFNSTVMSCVLYSWSKSHLPCERCCSIRQNEMVSSTIRTLIKRKTALTIVLSFHFIVLINVWNKNCVLFVFTGKNQINKARMNDGRIDWSLVPRPRYPALCTYRPLWAVVPTVWITSNRIPPPS